ncbi:uncharacterized protein LOC120357318 [Solenopsis invicta]|uniref:uncharacterized protein LOC120357318 n=1 Tax=Solenopsis invicta TaxID=13686 RepID=UPI00193DDC96|nr:uncharacterized protein LOC120357318 [Solenopsis invicta]
MEDRIQSILARVLPAILDEMGLPFKKPGAPIGRTTTQKGRTGQLGNTGLAPDPRARVEQSPSQNLEPSEQPWTIVVSKTAKKAAKKAEKRPGKESLGAPSTVDPPKGASNPAMQRGESKRATGPAPPKKGRTEPPRTSGSTKMRPPNTAAVSITCIDRESYAEVMRLARSEIDLEALEIRDLRPRRAITGGLILEIRGSGNGEKADALADQLREVTAHRSDDVADAVGKTGGCPTQQVKVGEICRASNGMGTCWVRCPMGAGKAVLAAPRLKVGWSSCRAVLLPPRGLQCFRCFANGHTQANCSSQVDRSGCCYRCGNPGHQCLAERGGGLAIAADPYRIPEDNPNWVGDTLGRVATVSQHARDAPPMLPVESGEGFVLVEWGPIDILGCYFPPSLTLGEYETALERAGECIARRSPKPIIVGGDFNAHARAWGSPNTNSRGRCTLEWAAGLDLGLLNRGRVSTFVGGRGESIVDLTWASPGALGRVSAWRVEAAPLGELTDHRLIEMVVASPPAEVRARVRRQKADKRWVLRKLDQEALEDSLATSTWAERGQDAGAEAETEWLCDAMSRACDASMPRSRPRAKRATYWWSEELAQLRRAMVAARRAYTRACGRGTEADEIEMRAALKEARKALRAAIRRAKAEAWEEFISGLTRDPWGRPYKMAKQRTSPYARPRRSLRQGLGPGRYDNRAGPKEGPDTMLKRRNLPQEVEEGQACPAQEARQASGGPVCVQAPLHAGRCGQNL